MFFIINRTRRRVSQKYEETIFRWKEKHFPTVKELGRFVGPGDVVEMVEIETKQKAYYGIPYKVQEPFTYGSERVNSAGDGYVTPQQKALDWLAEQVNPIDIVLPYPRCGGGKTCDKKGARLQQRDIQSVADCGLCWNCRTPKRDVVVPRPKKKT
jgi:hypothetical protein